MKEIYDLPTEMALNKISEEELEQLEPYQEEIEIFKKLEELTRVGSAKYPELNDFLRDFFEDVKNSTGNYVSAVARHVKYENNQNAKYHRDDYADELERLGNNRRIAHQGLIHRLVPLARLCRKAKLDSEWPRMIGLEPMASEEEPADRYKITEWAFCVDWYLKKRKGG